MNGVMDYENVTGFYTQLYTENKLTKKNLKKVETHPWAFINTVRHIILLHTIGLYRIGYTEIY
jgi:hypothetical protein